MNQQEVKEAFEYASEEILQGYMLEYVTNSKVECMSYVYDRECFDCGELAYAENGFLYKGELYCQDCCPEGYGE